MNVVANESKGTCQRCGEHIVFPAEMQNQNADCPHCGLETTLIPLRVRKADPQPAAPMETPMSDGMVVFAILMAIVAPIIGLLLGVWMLAKKRDGWGTVCIVVSLIFGVIEWALFTQH